MAKTRRYCCFFRKNSIWTVEKCYGKMKESKSRGVPVMPLTIAAPPPYCVAMGLRRGKAMQPVRWETTGDDEINTLSAI